MRITKQELWEKCQEAVVNDITGETTAEGIFNAFVMENTYKGLEGYSDDDEFITNLDKIVALDEAAELITYEDGINYLCDSGLLSDFTEYALGDMLDRCARVGERLVFTSKDWENALVEYLSEDITEYIEWLWEEK